MKTEYSMTDFVADKFRAQTPRVSVISSIAVAPNIAKVEATVFPPNASVEKVTAGILQATENNAAPVQASFLWQDENHTRIVGFVSTAREVRPMTPEVMASMQPATRKSRTTASKTEMSTNVYMDAKDQSLWEVKTGANGNYLSRAANDDFHEMLKVCASANGSIQTPKHVFSHSTNTLNAEALTRVNVGDFVQYVTATRLPAVAQGFIVEKSSTAVHVMIDGEGQLDTVQPKMIFAARDTTDFVKASALDLSLPIREYYKKAFSLPDMADYVEKIMQQIGDSVAA